jgi:molybdopterin synthase catalytic subunit
MRVRILFFGVLKDLAGQEGESLNLPDNATLGDVLSHYEARIPRLKELASSIAMSVNQEYAGPKAKLSQGDEIALLPPVSGGSGTPKEPIPAASPKGRPKHAAIVRERIETRSVLEGIKRGEDGAAVVFDGVVRDNTRGRRTVCLDYEAYEDMAVKQMEELAEQALARFPIRDVAILHRLGRLQIGETSVLIVVASAHRAAAFDACRWLIDTLKRTVPIWKKEYFQDGAVWADGEPFPAEIPRVQRTPAKKRGSSKKARI